MDVLHQGLRHGALPGDAQHRDRGDDHVQVLFIPIIISDRKDTVSAGRVTQMFARVPLGVR